MTGLAIKDVAEQTGLAPGTIRMWEQRYGFPAPGRTPSGYRRYSPEDVDVLVRAVALRDQGLSVAAALSRARAVSETGTDHPSIYGAINGGRGHAVRPRWLRKPTLLAISRAIEDEAMAHAAAPVCFAAFQEERFYRAVEHRYRRLAAGAVAAAVFADFPAPAHPLGGPAELPIAADDALGNEWAVVVDAPGFAACLVAWEAPARTGEDAPSDDERRFEALWTIDPEIVRHAARVAAGLAARVDPAFGGDVEGVLSQRPLAVDRTAPALTSLTNRIVEYLDRGMAVG